MRMETLLTWVETEECHVSSVTVCEGEKTLFSQILIANVGHKNWAKKQLRKRQNHE